MIAKKTLLINNTFFTKQQEIAKLSVKQWLQTTALSYILSFRHWNSFNYSIYINVHFNQDLYVIEIKESGAKNKLKRPPYF